MSSSILYYGYDPWLQSLYDFWDMDTFQSLCFHFHLALLAYGHPFSYMDFLACADKFMSASATISSSFRSFYDYIATSNVFFCLTIHVKPLSYVFGQLVHGLYPK